MTWCWAPAAVAGSDVDELARRLPDALTDLCRAVTTDTADRTPTAPTAGELALVSLSAEDLDLLDADWS